MTSVAVIGAGAVGCYYGARLWEAGHDVRFLMRRDYEAVRAHGLRIHSPDGDVFLERPTIADRPQDLGTVDWVLCSLKATAAPHYEQLIGPCVGEGTRILALMNGLGVEDRFAELFGAERVFGGLAFTAIYRDEPGQLRHLDLGKITIGRFLPQAGGLDDAEALWQDTKVPVTVTPSLLMSRWEKLGWNVPFAGLGVAAGGITTDRIVGDAELRALARALMDEVFLGGNADLAAHGEEARLDCDAIAERYFNWTDALGPYRSSTVIDFTEGRPLEVTAIFGEPLRRARALGLETPRLELTQRPAAILEPRRVLAGPRAARRARRHSATAAARSDGVFQCSGRGLVEGSSTGSTGSAPKYRRHSARRRPFSSTRKGPRFSQSSPIALGTGLRILSSPLPSRSAAA